MVEKNEEKIVVKISILWFFAAVLIIAALIAFFKNVIFATNTVEENEIKEIKIEANEQKVDVVKIMLENTTSNKKMINEQREVQYTTERIETDTLPLGEEVIIQEGIVGKKKVTALQEYEDEELISEEILDEIIEVDPIIEKINVGTSEFLSTYNVHIGDKMFFLEASDIKKEDNMESETICTVNRYIDVTLQEVKGSWAKVKYNTNEGYILQSMLTSETVTPKIIEKNRIAALQDGVNIDMDLNKVSGLTLSDYKTILAENAGDKNNIFESNAEVFYNMEQKYKINGVFLASIGIHESAWGTSLLAQDKMNLFGFKAYDRDPYNSAATFESYAECIETVAKSLAKNYLYTEGTTITEDVVATGSYCNGSTISAVNMRYASDQNWKNKIFSHMQYLYNRL